MNLLPCYARMVSNCRLEVSLQAKASVAALPIAFALLRTWPKPGKYAPNSV